MKSTDTLLLLAIAIGGWALLSKKNAASSLIFLPGGVSNIYWEGSTPVIDFTLLVQNTSSSGFTLESIAGQAYCDNTYIGNISSFIPTVIRGNSETPVKVSARLAPIGLINQIINAIAGNITKHIKLTGFVNTGILRAPIDVEFKIGI